MFRLGLQLKEAYAFQPVAAQCSSIHGNVWKNIDFFSRKYAHMRYGCPTQMRFVSMRCVAFRHDAK